MTQASRELELLVHKIQQQLAPKAEVLHDVRRMGRRSGVKRQIDVLVHEKIGQYDIDIVVDCKDYKRPVDVKGVEEFAGLLEDVGAQKGVLVSPPGFTEAAKARAKDFQIDLYSPVDTDPHKWQVTATIPALCDFRSAAISFGVSGSAPKPFRMPMDFFHSVVAHDAAGKPLGTPVQRMVDRWNDGDVPDEVGETGKIMIFGDQATFVDNGYGDQIEVDLYAHLLVERQLYYGQLPVPQISGFKDELSGHVITNAFQVGVLDPNKIEEEWHKIDDEAEAEVKPVITLRGVVCWEA